MKRILKIGAIAIAILFVIMVALPLLINANSFRPKIESELTSALGRQVTVGNLSLSILSRSVVADNIAIADDPAFGKPPFITAKSLKVGVELMPTHLLETTECDRTQAGAARDHAAESCQREMEFLEHRRGRR